MDSQYVIPPQAYCLVICPMATVNDKKDIIGKYVNDQIAWRETVWRYIRIAESISGMTLAEAQNPEVKNKRLGVLLHPHADYHTISSILAYLTCAEGVKGKEEEFKKARELFPQQPRPEDSVFVFYYTHGGYGLYDEWDETTSFLVAESQVPSDWSDKIQWRDIGCRTYVRTALCYTDDHGVKWSEPCRLYRAFPCNEGIASEVFEAEKDSSGELMPKGARATGVSRTRRIPICKIEYEKGENGPDGYWSRWDKEVTTKEWSIPQKDGTTKTYEVVIMVPRQDLQLTSSGEQEWNRTPTVKVFYYDKSSDEDKYSSYLPPYIQEKDKESEHYNIKYVSYLFQDLGEEKKNKDAKDKSKIGDETEPEKLDFYSSVDFAALLPKIRRNLFIAIDACHSSIFAEVLKTAGIDESKPSCAVWTSSDMAKPSWRDPKYGSYFSMGFDEAMFVEGTLEINGKPVKILSRIPEVSYGKIRDKILENDKDSEPAPAYPVFRNRGKAFSISKENNVPYHRDPVYWIVGKDH